MLIDEARGWMEQAASYRRGHIKSVVITGGEPFYNIELLRGVLNAAVTCGVVPIVMTNAFWASSLQAAIETLRGLPQIRMIGVSTDAYHQRFVPIGNAINALLAARSLGLGYNAAVCTEVKEDPAYRNTKAELAKVIGESLVLPATTQPAGRALRFKPDRFETSTEFPASACVSADCPTIFPDGSVIGCMALMPGLPLGHPLLLGKLRDRPLGEILDAAERNTALHMIRVWGPGRLLKMLAEAGEKQCLPKRYTKHGCCDLCHSLASNPDLLTRLLELTSDTALAEKVAYGRLYYLNEEFLLQPEDEDKEAHTGEYGEREVTCR
jgi:hypothetical protein